MASDQIGMWQFEEKNKEMKIKDLQYCRL